jgi:hypothetical protein
VRGIEVVWEGQVFKFYLWRAERADNLHGLFSEVVGGPSGGLDKLVGFISRDSIGGVAIRDRSWGHRLSLGLVALIAQKCSNVLHMHMVGRATGKAT